MDWHAHRSLCFGNHLATQDGIADLDNRARGCTDMLCDRQNELAGWRAIHYEARIREFFTFWWVNTAVNIKNLSHAATCSDSLSVAIILPVLDSLGSGQNQCWMPPFLGIMSMQSTGQGSTHKSQPVHSSTMTVCISFAAPKMASTGQA